MRNLPLSAAPIPFCELLAAGKKIKETRMIDILLISRHSLHDIILPGLYRIDTAIENLHAELLKVPSESP